MRYYRTIQDGAARLVARDGEKAYDLTAAREGLDSFAALASVADVLGTGIDGVVEGLTADAPLLDADSVASRATVPAVPDEVWAAGVTYQVSSDAREEESGRGEIYQGVFEGDRPELFFKATASRTVGPGEKVGIRGDSDWDVPEPELAVVVHRGDIVGYTVGNDMSSRSIEGDNPLYLPQAKIYDRCCAIGPAIASPETVGDPQDLELSMRIERGEEVMFDDSTSTSQLVRSPEELVSYLNRHNQVPELAVLLTGTSLVPEEFTLEADDEIAIGIENVGRLENGVTTV
ncbi:fumarylacetoacetate hydrolase family protein [Halococcus thailandensis]|uniref:2-keto-3-deoxyxylonate dehydratase n=1 Tax=Halococcus thailandensis JCM 13552 TaxID=1227457 RepID=M0MWN6_9EURY|nr:fumarylacetoacetate hydrolase family protein [Halococcus thailandensis]EMA50142.1 2-keto-3-deoxyxylonate dehydratase [Halococcus thailandensis JCM 13552]